MRCNKNNSKKEPGEKNTENKTKHEQSLEKLFKIKL